MRAHLLSYFLYNSTRTSSDGWQKEKQKNVDNSAQDNILYTHEHRTEPPLCGMMQWCTTIFSRFLPPKPNRKLLISKLCIHTSIRIYWMPMHRVFSYYISLRCASHHSVWFSALFQPSDIWSFRARDSDKRHNVRCQSYKESVVCRNRNAKCLHVTHSSLIIIETKLPLCHFNHPVCECVRVAEKRSLP